MDAQGCGALSPKCCLRQVGVLPFPFSHLQTPADGEMDRVSRQLIRAGDFL